VLLQSQVGEKRADPSASSGQVLGRVHVLGVACVVKQDVARDPAYVGLFGALGIVFQAQGVADLSEQLLGCWFHGFLCAFDRFRVLFYSPTVEVPVAQSASHNPHRTIRKRT
jgi:hypothetical protein